jgi:hypothetical protein
MHFCIAAFLQQVPKALHSSDIRRGLDLGCGRAAMVGDGLELGKYEYGKK